MSGQDEFGRVPSQGETAPAESRRKPRRPEPTPSQRALGLLVRREHSRRELARKLVARGVDAAEAGEAVERMVEAGWQDDTRFAEFLVRSRAASGYGPVHVRAELSSHGLDREVIAAALENFDGDWREVARDLVRRRFGAVWPGDAAQKRKAADLLLRRGFGSAFLREIIGGMPEQD